MLFKCSYPIEKCQSCVASINVFLDSISTGYKINWGGCLGMPYIFRQFGTWVPKILENFARGYQKVGKSDFLWHWWRRYSYCSDSEWAPQELHHSLYYAYVVLRLPLMEVFWHHCKNVQYHVQQFRRVKSLHHSVSQCNKRWQRETIRVEHNPLLEPWTRCVYKP